MRYQPISAESNVALSLVFFPYPLVDLLAVDRDVLGRIYAQPDLAAPSIQYGDRDMVADTYGFVGFAGEYEHNPFSLTESEHLSKRSRNR